MNCEAENRIELKVPSTKEMMLVVRLTTAGALAKSGLTVDLIDEAKLATEEACNCLVRSSQCQTLTVSFFSDGDEYCIRAETGLCDCGCAEEMTDDEIAVVRYVLLSVADKVEMQYDDGQLRAIEMRKRLPS